MLFYNLTLGNKEVVSYQLNQPFKGYAKVGGLPSGVDHIEPAELFKLLNLIPLNLISKAKEGFDNLISDSIAGINHKKIHYVI